jgi:hypothetical protein
MEYAEVEEFVLRIRRTEGSVYQEIEVHDDLGKNERKRIEIEVG